MRVAGHELTADLVVLDMMGEVINLRMDWLGSYHVNLDGY